MENEQNDGFLKEARRAIIGLTVAFLIVALAGAIVFYLLPTLSSRTDWIVLEDNSVSIYYKETNLSENTADTYLSRMQEAKEEIIEKLDLKKDNLPDKIRIYLHGDLAGLKSSIAERKSSTSTDEPLAIMNVIVNYEVEPLLVRLLTLFAWGKPSSEFLRLGLQSFFSDTMAQPHSRVTGLGDDLFSFQEIISLERTGNIPRNLLDRVFDNFDSPNAPAGLGLSGFSSLMRSDTAESPYRYELEAESVSFVAYLIEEFGIEPFRHLWRASSLQEGANRVYDTNLKKLEQNWLDFVKNRSDSDFYNRLYRAENMFSNGKLAKTLSILDEFPEEARVIDYLSLKARTHFYLGEWEKSRKYFSELEDRQPTKEILTFIERYRELLRTYQSGSRKEKYKLDIFATEEIEDFENLVKDWSHPIKRAKGQLPSLVGHLNSIRVYVDNEPGPGTWSHFNPPKNVIFGAPSDVLDLKISRLLVNEMSRTPTYSNLLRQGLISFLLDSEIFEPARKILVEGNWESIAGLSIKPGPKTNSSTQAGAFVGYLLSQLGPDKFKQVWYLTTPLGGDNSLDTALKEVVGKGLTQVESDLEKYLETYNE